MRGFLSPVKGEGARNRFGNSLNSKFGTVVLFSTYSFANDEYFKFACKEKS